MIDELKQAYENSTQGEWSSSMDSAYKGDLTCECLATLQDGGNVYLLAETHTQNTDTNMRFTALAHNAMPELLLAWEIVETLESVLEANIGHLKFAQQWAVTSDLESRQKGAAEAYVELKAWLTTYRNRKEVDDG